MLSQFQMMAVLNDEVANAMQQDDLRWGLVHRFESRWDNLPGHATRPGALGPGEVVGQV